MSQKYENSFHVLLTTELNKIKKKLITGHVDYLVISWLFFHINISLPFVASGDNLAMPLVGSLLRNSGAFYIRRQFGDDAIYRAVVNEYMTQLLEYGNIDAHLHFLP